MKYLNFIKYLVILPVMVFAIGFVSRTVALAELNSASSTTLVPVALENPLNNINSIQDLLVAILNIVMILMIPVIVFFIIYSGFRYVTAQGNASQVEEATRSLTYAIIGGVLILAAIAITEIIKGVVAAF